MEKKKSSAGIIIAVVVFCLLIAGGAVAAILLLNANKDKESGKVVDSTTAEQGGEKQPEKTPTSSATDNTGIIAASADNGYIGDHVRGKRDSKVLVVEYADPQCPGCAMVMPKMDAIYEKYKDKVAFVYRHYPIAGHQNAVSAATAIEAAGKQGYFWEMLDALFDDQVSWAYRSGNNLTLAYIQIFRDITEDEGDVNQFKKDLNDSSLTKKINFDKEQGNKDKLSATPTVLVNGKMVDFYSSSDVQKTIETAIENALK